MLLVLALGWGATVRSQETAHLTFSPEGGSFDCGEVVEFSVMIDDSVTDLRGFTLTLEFDPGVVAPFAVSAGALLAEAACPHFFQWVNEGGGDDFVLVDGAGLGCSIAGPGELARLVFEGVEEGTSFLRCRAAEGHLRDGENGEIPHDCDEATIQYLCPIAAEPRPWGAIKQIYK